MRSDHYTCANCCWWSQTLPMRSMDPPSAVTVGAIGSCHADPPYFATVDGKPLSMFPVTHKAQFCSRWEDPRYFDDPPEDGGGNVIALAGRKPAA